MSGLTPTVVLPRRPSIHSIEHRDRVFVPGNEASSSPATVDNLKLSSEEMAKMRADMAKATEDTALTSSVQEATEAEKLLSTAQSVLVQRGTERQLTNERSMPRIVEMFHTLTKHKLSEEEGHLFMVCLKLVRLTGGVPFKDDYVDAINYVALAHEAGTGR